MLSGYYDEHFSSSHTSGTLLHAWCMDPVLIWSCIIIVILITYGIHHGSWPLAAKRKDARLGTHWACFPIVITLHSSVPRWLSVRHKSAHTSFKLKHLHSMYLVGSYAFIHDHIPFRHLIPSISITFTHSCMHHIGEEVHEEVNPLRTTLSLNPKSQHHPLSIAAGS